MYKSSMYWQALIYRRELLNKYYEISRKRDYAQSVYNMWCVYRTFFYTHQNSHLICYERGPNPRDFRYINIYSCVLLLICIFIKIIAWMIKILFHHKKVIVIKLCTKVRIKIKYKILVSAAGYRPTDCSVSHIWYRSLSGRARLQVWDMGHKPWKLCVQYDMCELIIRTSHYNGNNSGIQFSRQSA